MDDVVQHTQGLADDNDISFAVAATRMAQHLDDVEASDIIGDHRK